jgi:hypothetical protein
MEDHIQLYKEATFVGIALVPMWYAVTKFTLATRVLNNNPQAKAMLGAAAGGLLPRVINLPVVGWTVLKSLTPIENEISFDSEKKKIWL